MTVYWVTTRRNSYTITHHLAAYGRSLRGLVRPLDYAGLISKRAPAVYVLTDIERLSNWQRRLAAAAADRLAASGATVLNRPADVQLRFDVLKQRADCGQNAFHVFRADHLDASRVRYPAFLRCENDHQGARSQLIESAAELRLAVQGQSTTRFFFRDEHGKRRLVRFGWKRRRRLLVTEFCDTVDAKGVYRKYAAFCIGGRVIARHLFFGENWMLKGPQLMLPKYLAEERQYVTSNPHCDELSRVFRDAKIDYGRVDYALLDGKIQVWEINTNPMITAPKDELIEARHPIQEIFSERFHAAVLALATGGASPSRNANVA